MSSVVDSGLAPIILLAAIGLVLWGVGIRIIRAAFAAVSLFIGAPWGWALGGLMPESLGLPPWAMILLCAVLLACLAALAYRFAVAICLAGLMAVAGPLTVRVTADFQPGWFGGPATATDDGARGADEVPALVGEPGDDDADAAADDTGIIDLLADEDLAEPEDRWWERDRVEPETPPEPEPEPEPGAADDQAPDDPTGDDIARELVIGEVQARVEQGLQRLGEDLGIESERTEASIDRIGALLDRAGQEVITLWEQTPPRIRPTLIAASVLGALLGILLAALGPNLSAALLTALGGAAMWLACGFVLVERGGIADESWLPGSLAGWASWWMAASIIGLAIQWTLRPKVADKSAD